ncbi:MAG: HlyD family efflux transporter periplasmic adaptor subunit [Acidobacteriota bacterium]|nr:HlyD family efflux transporter periplasmic adaptor subunit [Acidobacteriota bacterium]
MTRTRWTMAGVAAVGVASVVMLARAGSAAPDPPRPEAQHAGARATGGIIAGPGRVEPVSEEVDVAFELSGKLALVEVEEGDRVRTGDVLARLESEEYEARLRAAEARLAVAEAERLRLTNGARPEERREAAAVSAQADAALVHARLEVDRGRRLFEAGVIPREQLDRVERDWRVAGARQAETAERLAAIDSDARADELARADAGVRLARASVAEARALVRKTVLRAPIDGVVLRRHKQTGESVSLEGPSSTVVTVADTRTLRVRVDVDERDVAALGLGQPAWVTARAYGETRFPGRVVRIGQMLGRKTVHTDEPMEKVDTKVLETLIELEPGTKLPVGLRVDAFIEP